MQPLRSHTSPWLLLFVLTAACSGDSGPSAPAPAAALRADGVLPAAPVVGSVMTPAVIVSDARGRAVAGASVSWEVAAGGGSVAVATSQTDGSGRAAGSWQLGTLVGTNTLVARVGSVTPVSFTVTTRGGAPATAVPLPDNPAEAPAGAPIRPGVRIQDEFGNAVQGAEVLFTPESAASGSVVGASQITDAGGVARPELWELGTRTGSQRLQAISGGIRAEIAVQALAGAPAALQRVEGHQQAALPGAPVGIQPRVRLTDVHGNGIAGGSVTFSVTAGGGTVTGSQKQTDAEGEAAPDGWVLGAAGTNVLTAAAGPLSVEFTAEATGSPDVPRMLAFAGQGTSCTAGGAGCVFTVHVATAGGQPLPGEVVTWRSGAGTPLGSSVSDARGYASKQAAPGAPGVGAVIAVLESSGEEVIFPFRAVTGGQFDIDVRFTGTATPSQQEVVLRAARRWEQVITGDLADMNIAPGTLNGGECGVSHPALSGPVDDLVVFVEIVEIDGAGGVLGSAGPCLYAAGRLPIVGSVRLDSRDVESLETRGRLFDVALHELGHVLGITRSIWADRNWNLLQGLDTSTPIFLGTRALPGFVLAGAPLGPGVPVENCINGDGTPRQGCGSGTIHSHWREAVLGNELMTGFMSQSSANPMSTVTVGALMDMGYEVDFGAADAFTLAAGGIITGFGKADLPLIELPPPPLIRMR